MAKRSSLLILLSVVGSAMLPARVCRAQAPATPAIPAPPPAPPDVVETKRGDVYRGTIIERVRGDHVVLLLPSGEFRRFDTSEIVSAGPAQSYRPSDEVERDPGAHVHDGFYLRLQFGLGYTRISTSTTGADLSVGGPGYGLGIALGGAVSSHLTIYGTLLDTVAPSPTGKVQGPSPGSINGKIAALVFGGGVAGMAADGVGAGVAYYFDSNLFLAGSLLASRLLVDDGLTTAYSDWGFTFQGLIGKEWWVSDNWGLGVAGQVLLGAMKDGAYANEPVPTWELASLSVLFSATYN